MKKNLLSLLLLATSVVTIMNSCKKDDDDNTPSPIVSERTRIINEYNTNYLGSTVSDPFWTGNSSTCDAGAFSTDAKNKTLQRINYFRKMAGLSANIVFETSRNAKCQEAALMMAANNALSHTPPDTWSCYTTDGATAAGKSNLAFGGHSSSAITLYMQDDGSSNTAVGHRRWILYSKADTMGVGSTNITQALWVIETTPSTTQVVPEFIAWPPKGYVPAPLVYNRWSLGVPGGNFSSAAITMTDSNGANIPCTIESSTSNGYGDNTIVWVPSGINTSSATDVTYHVTVSNVLLNSVPESYSYDVIIIQP